MMRIVAATLLTLMGAPALAASGPFLSLGNTNFVVLIAFIVFVAVLVYVKVPGMLTAMLDKRAASISAELEAARALREEANSLLVSYERKSREAAEQAERIVETARADAIAVAEAAKADLQVSIQRRLHAAEEQIAQAESEAMREVREKAISVAIAAAGAVLTKQMTDDVASSLVDASITEVGARLN